MWSGCAATGCGPELVEIAPTHCPNGHALAAGRVLIGYGTPGRRQTSDVDVDVDVMIGNNVRTHVLRGGLFGSRPMPDAAERADQSRRESEQTLDELLAAGWQIASVVPVAPRGTYEISNSAFQEAWTVFLTKRDIS